MTCLNASKMLLQYQKHNVRRYLRKWKILPALEKSTILEANPFDLTKGADEIDYNSIPVEVLYWQHFNRAATDDSLQKQLDYLGKSGWVQLRSA